MAVAKHKYENARVEVTSTLAVDKLNEIAAQAGEAVFSSIPGMPKITVTSRGEGSTGFTVASLGGNDKLMAFRFTATAEPSGTRGRSEITMFRTSQSRYMFVPVGPKSMLGWREYKRFADKFRTALADVDPTASFDFVERPAP